MRIEMWPIARVKPYPNNPRVNDDAVSAVATSIREFGWRQPIVVDGTGTIIVGHTRWKAAQRLGYSQVPVHVAADLTPEQIKAYCLADNKLSELAEWDFNLLSAELAELQLADFDLSQLGFSRDELTSIMGDGAQVGQCDPDDIPGQPDAALTQPGDLVVLGQHRLLCGDSSNPAHADRLLGGQPVHLVNSDLKFTHIFFVGRRRSRPPGVEVWSSHARG